jgi:membrane protease subunit HflK
VNTARGDVARFNQVLAQYRLDPQTTRTRLYYEMVEQVFAGGEQVQLIDRNLSNFIPLLNLNQEPATGGQP